MKSRVGNASLALTALEAFVWGGVARAVATIITFPGNRAKMIMQGLKNSKDTNVVKVKVHLIANCANQFVV